MLPESPPNRASHVDDERLVFWDRDTARLSEAILSAPDDDSLPRDWQTLWHRGACGSDHCRHRAGRAARRTLTRHARRGVSRAAAATTTGQPMIFFHDERPWVDRHFPERPLVFDKVVLRGWSDPHGGALEVVDMPSKAPTDVGCSRSTPERRR